MTADARYNLRQLNFLSFLSKDTALDKMSDIISGEIFVLLKQNNALLIQEV